MSAVRAIRVEGPLDLAGTLFPLCRGAGDPTMRLGGSQAVVAMRTPQGAAALHVRVVAGHTVEAEAWGPGASSALEDAPGLVGALDDASGFEPVHDVLVGVWRRHRGVRLTRTRRLVRTLIPAILEQKVTGAEARRAYRRLAEATGEPAPGPFGLRLPPDPARVAGLAYHDLHGFGVERRRAETLRFACARADRLDRLAGGAPEEVKARLAALPGVGTWTVAEVARLALGDPDAVSVGDFHLKHLVAWALAGEPRGTDERMLELLEPYRGHRGRVQRLLEASGIRAPRYGPRLAPRAIERI
jgi:3-methyladenine DNA glycosylase/8-oxoguanine DNA glycosylase